MMIGPKDKGIIPERVDPIEGDVFINKEDLRSLPKYISFKAAALRSLANQQYLAVIISTLFAIYFVTSRYEIYSLYGKLRQKEYILAPGVQDFLPVSPQAVPESYVSYAVSDFVGQLGNVTADSIVEQYGLLSRSMSPQLKVKFGEEAGSWIGKVKTENISELLSVSKKMIEPSGQGKYRAVVWARRDTFINNEYLGHADEVIEMELELVPPQPGRHWYLQMTRLSRTSAETYDKKKTLIP